MHCDDYLFGEVAPAHAGGTRPSIAAILASIYRSDPATRTRSLIKLAKRISAAADKAPVTINAMATHMPQLYSANPERAGEAIDALCALPCSASDFSKSTTSEPSRFPRDL